jgi:regulator of protease activity HflC (stomatin/prohibitin superfamily)
LSYYIQQDKVPHFYVKYRSDDLNHFTHGILRNIARDAFNEVAANYGVDDINGPKLSDFLHEVKTKINEQVTNEGVVIDQFGFLETPRLPQSYQEAMLNKQTAIQTAQQKENELRATQAEAAKQIAAAEGEAKARVARAEGEAKANTVLANSVTDRLLTLRKLDIQQQAVDRWNGSVPTIQGGTGSGSGGLNIVVPMNLQKQD